MPGVRCRRQSETLQDLALSRTRATSSGGTPSKKTLALRSWSPIGTTGTVTLSATPPLKSRWVSGTPPPTLVDAQGFGRLGDVEAVAVTGHGDARHPGLGCRLQLHQLCVLLWGRGGVGVGSGPSPPAPRSAPPPTAALTSMGGWGGSPPPGGVTGVRERHRRWQGLAVLGRCSGFCKWGASTPTSCCRPPTHPIPDPRHCHCSPPPPQCPLPHTRRQSAGSPRAEGAPFSTLHPQTSLLGSAKTPLTSQLLPTPALR